MKSERECREAHDNLTIIVSGAIPFNVSAESMSVIRHTLAFLCWVIDCDDELHQRSKAAVASLIDSSSSGSDALVQIRRSAENN